VFALLLGSWCGATAGSFNAGPQDRSPKDYEVYNALLNLISQIPKKNPYVGIANRTLNFKCGSDPGALILINLCSGMRMPPDTADQVVGTLRKEWTDAERATFDDFSSRNSDSIRLRDNFSAPWRHGLFGMDSEKTPSTKSASDLDIYLSRVGFNLEQTEAIIYALTISHLDQVPTEGDYFLFRLEGGKWAPEGRVTYMEHKTGDAGWTVVLPDESK
jgi:hypothetical protein